MTVERIAMDPSELLRDVERLMAVRATEKGIRLVVARPGPIPARMYSDPLRLKQILLNLVSNAVKFTATVQVQIVVTTIASPANETLLRVDVIDTGVGLAPDHLEHIFEAFSEADSTMTRRYGGTGLGLHISRALARMLGGDGYTLASTLRARGWDRPVIALTAHAMGGDEARCLEAGCDAYVSKPFNRTQLIEACRAALARHSLARTPA